MVKSAEELKDPCVFEKKLDEILACFEEELSYIKGNGLSFAQCHAPFPPYLLGRPETWNMVSKSTAASSNFVR